MDIEDAWTAVQTKFESVKKNLLPDLMSMELMKNDKLVQVFVLASIILLMKLC